MDTRANDILSLSKLFLNTYEFKLCVDVYLFGAEINSVVFVLEDLTPPDLLKSVVASQSKFDYREN
jgi:hypothetical protein